LRQALKIVSLFDGISCGRLALERAGYAVSDYAAFEIDRFARSISRHNYPGIRQCGDVLDADFTEFKGYDIVMGGSPCTFWSIAKQDREVDKDGMGWKLFMSFVEAVRTISPRYFLYENVASMPKSIKAYISEELDCEPVLINSALVSAQHRKRLYWTNIAGIVQPGDKGILLKDILETGIAARDKSYCIDASYYKGGNHSSHHKQSGKRMMAYEPIALADKSQTILATLHKENALSMVKRGKTGLICASEVDGLGDVGAALRTRTDGNGSFKRLEVRGDGKLNALTTAQTDSVVCSPIRVGAFGSGGQGNRIYSVHGKTVALMAHGGGRGGKVGLYKIDLPDGDYIVRKLTPVEAERCQTLPDGFTALGIDDKGRTVSISNTQRYKCVGNGWTADVIAHILKHMDFSYKGGG
jgi:DNA (cytosine-5)-methyltransferase 3A